MNKGFIDFFNQGFDILCLQETKMQREQNAFEFTGYEQYWNSANKKGYSGTAVFTKEKPLNVTYGMGIPEHDEEGRIITLEFDEFYLVDCYTPNSKRGLLRLPYRMIWEDAFREFLSGLDSVKPVVLCGDLNVAHTEMDIKNARSNVNNAGFTPQEREKMTALLGAGFVDTFRYMYPDKRDAYTWWSFMGNARANNTGWRIDYFIVSARLKTSVAEAEIFDQVYGSDHCPVGLLIDTDYK
jgi:exodeoxyribonuclease-3